MKTLFSESTRHTLQAHASYPCARESYLMHLYEHLSRSTGEVANEVAGEGILFASSRSLSALPPAILSRWIHCSKESCTF
jgi:hypothetical protein